MLRDLPDRGGGRRWEGTMGTPMPPHHRWPIAALALALGAAFAGGVWSMTLSPLEQHVASQNGGSAPIAVEHVSSAPPHRLRLGTTVSGEGSVVADAGGTTWVLGRGTLSTVTDGVATVVAHGTWSDRAVLTPSNEGGLWIASGRSLWMVGPYGAIGKRLQPSVGSISAVLAVDGRTWVAGSNGMLASIDPYTANTIQSYYLGTGTYQLAATSGFVFVATSDATQPPIVRLDPGVGATVPVPGAQPGPIAAADGRLWWGTTGRVQCVVARTLRRCGQLDVASASMRNVAAPTLVAANGEALWVVYAGTQGADLALFDPSDGHTIAGPIGLPGSTVGSVAVNDTSAWIGMADAGSVVQVDRT
jgi:hypothetical protein